jgi:hypothetical protein
MCNCKSRWDFPTTRNITYALTHAATPHEYAGVDFEALGRDELLSRMFSVTNLSSTDEPYRRTNRDMMQLLAAQRGMYDFKTGALQKALNQVSDPRVTDMLNNAAMISDSWALKRGVLATAGNTPTGTRNEGYILHICNRHNVQP